MPVRPIPEGQDRPTPYLCVKNAAGAIDFYKKVFGAVEIGRLTGPDGRIGHAELRIGSGRIMLADEHPEMGIVSPLSIGQHRSPVTIHLYVEDVDAVYRSALAAGASSAREPVDEFYGDRAGQIKDPSGHIWHLATHKEDISMEEMKRRFDQMTKGSN